MFWLEIDGICLDVSFIWTSTLIQWIQWTFWHSFLHDYGAIVPPKRTSNRAIEDMNKIDVRAFPWLQANADPIHWAELFFEGRRYGHLTSNIAESLNSWLLSAREKPVLAMLETIRHQSMTWFSNRQHSELNTAGLLVAKVAKEIQEAINTQARRYRYYQSTETKFEVLSKETLKEYRVDLAEHSCSCRDWKANGYPCGHALAVILGLKHDPQTYTESFY
jgi:SWIM zinc finger